MTIRSRLLLALASLLLVLMYVFPIWKISLEAPQYPEGIGMYIWIDTVTGEKPHDLANINGLNHYIGMKTIEPDTITELKIMPWIIGLLMGLGLLSAAAGKRWMLYTWVALFLVAAAAGLIDFYLWEYDYGHDLSPTAAIKVPGMSYQPPLIGSKKLLNFTARSWPALGGWAAFASMALGLVTAVLQFRSAKKTAGSEPTPEPPRKRTAGTTRFAAAGMAALLLAACTPEPKPLVHGEDVCAHCKMALANPQYGAELVTTKGKIYTFDAIECLAAHQLEGRVAPEDVHSLWVVDFQNPPGLVPIDEAFFLHSKDLRSPMGMNLTAFGPDITEQAVQHSFYGNILDWNGVLDVVRHQTPPPGADAMHPAMHRPHGEAQQP